MRKGMWSAAAFVALLSGAIVVLGGPRLQAADTVTMGSDSEPNAFKFFPAEVTVPVGSTVVWENKSPYVQHDAVAKKGTFKSPLLNKGEKFESEPFTTPGDYEYICTVPGHEGAGMTGVVRVTGGAAPTPAAPAPTTTTQAGSSGGGATTTTAKAAQPTTTTASKAAGSGSTTTTAVRAEPGATTTSAPALTPTSAPDVAGMTTTTTGHGAEEAAAGDHGSGGAADKKEQKSSPLGIAFAGISTVVLVGISAKLLGS